MSAFGQRLREERESRKITLEEIARETRIRRTYLEALESGDLASLPGGAFNKGYVRSYAEYLGVEADPWVAAYVAEEAEQSRRGQLEGPAALTDLSRAIEDRLTLGDTPLRRGVPGWLAPAAGVAALALLALGGWWLTRDGGAPEPVREPAREARAEAAAEAPVATPPPVALPREPDIDAGAPAAPADEIGTDSGIVPEPVAKPVAKPASGIEVPDSGVGTDVVDRRLVGRGDRFRAGTQVWFWTRVTGGEPGQVLDHVWLHEGREVGRTRLTLGGPHWRTQSRKTLYRGLEGEWAVEARDDAGRVLSRHAFVVEPAR